MSIWIKYDQRERLKKKKKETCDKKGWNTELLNGEQTKETPGLAPSKAGIYPLTTTVVAHAEDLDHADKDVDEVQFEADTLVDYITLDQATFGKTSVV